MRQILRPVLCAWFVALASGCFADGGMPWRPPVDCRLDSVRVTRIGEFGLLRKARPGIPAHLHAGVDIARPSRNYRDEPVYPAAPGLVVSLRDDGPYAQMIIEHRLSDSVKIWSVYEHIAGIRCGLGDSAFPDKPIARLMDRAELDRYGWQFDHLHFEILRVRPQPCPVAGKLPFCRYRTYGLACFTLTDLDGRYIDPLFFIAERGAVQTQTLGPE